MELVRPLMSLHQASLESGAGDKLAQIPKQGIQVKEIQS